MPDFGKNKKALIHDPYLDTLGGGERYCVSVAECLLRRGWSVYLLWNDRKIVNDLKARFGLEIGRVRLIGKRAEELSWWDKIKIFRKMNMVFWLSDGSVPFLPCRQNLLHFQVPFQKVNGRYFLNKIKLLFVSRIVCNSKFTQKFINQEYGVNSAVLYPPVDVEKFKTGKKKKIILAVGRFEDTMQAKKQDILIEAFKKIVDAGLTGWKLRLVGGSFVPEGKNKLITELKRKSRCYPVEFLVNVSFAKLKKSYEEAALFWHAAGYGVDDSREPWKTEHFGMTTVEAMAAGCVPLVMDKGGLREIVRRGVGERWRTVGELTRKSLSLIKKPKKMQLYSRQAQKSSRRFSKEKFCQRLKEIIADS